MSIRTMLAISGLFLVSTGSFAAGVYNEDLNNPFRSSWADSGDDMRNKNAYLSTQFAPPDKSAGTRAASTSGEQPSAPPPSAPPSSAQPATPAGTAAPLVYGNSSGDKMKYPVPCNEDDKHYVVDYRYSPPCNLAYPSADEKSLDIRPMRMLSAAEAAERARRPHLVQGGSNGRWVVAMPQE